MDTVSIRRSRWLQTVRKQDRGQSLVETALIFPILITFLIGAADLARVARASISVANAAKAGAQYASRSNQIPLDTAGIQAVAAAEAPNLTLNTVPSYSCVCSDGSASTCQPTDCLSSHKEETITVTTQATVKPIMKLPGLPPTWTISGKAIQRCLQ